MGLLFFLPFLVWTLLVAADGGKDAHEAKICKEPRETNSKTKESAELIEKLQTAPEERQRRQHRCDHACIIPVARERAQESERSEEELDLVF